ncbi:MAG: hypothetical protein ACLUD2_03155 [Clostridium sp.]
MFSLVFGSSPSQVGIDDGVYIAAFVQALAEQVREGGAGGESAVPGVAPDIVVDV